MNSCAQVTRGLANKRWLRNRKSNPGGGRCRHLPLTSGRPKLRGVKRLVQSPQSRRWGWGCGLWLGLLLWLHTTGVTGRDLEGLECTEPPRVAPPPARGKVTKGLLCHAGLTH